MRKASLDLQRAVMFVFFFFFLRYVFLRSKEIRNIYPLILLVVLLRCRNFGNNVLSSYNFYRNESCYTLVQVAKIQKKNRAAIHKHGWRLQLSCTCLYTIRVTRPPRLCRRTLFSNRVPQLVPINLFFCSSSRHPVRTRYTHINSDWLVAPPRSGGTPVITAFCCVY